MTAKPRSFDCDRRDSLQNGGKTCLATFDNSLRWCEACAQRNAEYETGARKKYGRAR